MAALLACATWAGHALHPGFLWLQSFAEAALVGGLADWFAVTALFRRPMGLPIPHTAIIPRSKDRIGRALAAFLGDNFLTARNIARRLEALDAAGFLAAVLERPATKAARPGDAAHLAARLLATASAERLWATLRDGAGKKLAEAAWAPLLGRLVDGLLGAGLQRPLLDRGIAWLLSLLDEEEEEVRRLVKERTGWLLQLVNLDRRVADDLLGGLRDLLHDLEARPDHPLRLRLDEALATLARDLAADGAMARKTGVLMKRLFRNSAVRAEVDAMLDRLWRGAAARLQGAAHAEKGDESGAAPEPGIAPAVAGALRDDAELQAILNALFRRLILAIVARYGAAIAGVVADTVEGWNAETVTAKLEGAVLRDLQYIRLNGTIIGGLIGLALHALLRLW